MRLRHRVLLAGLVLAAAGACATDEGRTLDPPAGATSEGTQVLVDGSLVAVERRGLNGFWVDSPVFVPGGPIPAVYTAPGGGTSPPIRWGLAPPGAVEVALVLEDTVDDFPMWIVTGLDPALEGFAEGTVPPGATVHAAGYPEAEYFGPDAPPGETRAYEFTLYALNQELDVEPEASGEAVVAAVETASFTRASFFATMTGA